MQVNHKLTKKSQIEFINYRKYFFSNNNKDGDCLTQTPLLFGLRTSYVLAKHDMDTVFLLDKDCVRDVGKRDIEREEK